MEITEFPYPIIKEAIGSLREVDIKKWIYSIKLNRELCFMVESKGIRILWDSLECSKENQEEFKW